MIFKSRRIFLKNSFLTSVIFITCSGELFAAVTPMQTIALVQKDLFPDTLHTPQSSDINASYYLYTILNHSRVTDKTKSFIKDGAKWLNEASVEKYKKIYTKLSAKERQNILKEISQNGWGENWIITIMTYLLEAMLGDPIYGGNKNQSGWKWLNHTSGLPRPTKAIL
ncbi:MAG: hypothetical protein A2513_00205 [Sulfurimonas sp. RIFOXYD12_FULL_33_39]|uniref:gluconate 2-dehydrogenase subunit 3 family protein n=1 Tax=unclassified Sulfurimonas TaxID=2623549 RepID=UPI0008C35671|nr:MULTISPECIES: gluconate 2-dehydrogenase subunit 3 family protein [unclassified Sulfurimonas]OHE04239.1 MAG: hypothetical protein A3G74_00350 [Sulfurimonas sp. RIFCSPLOWO2_12_FULL_34_6]OHE10754.1 MAG: hypothetical protein A2513_00205 [Sulfurimonas sp. RIFOXYD12_FULL_33_39]OHE13476.1 MAG: hypothetical protein A2530_07975 [Sulfurimonas sp. RIFOXYD2_FULL_34_21]